MYIDFKVTGWERINIEETQHKKILKALKEGKIKSIDELYAKFGDYCYSDGVLTETIVEITKKGKSVMEFYNNDGEIIFQNK